jgi:hypothetical protein
MTVPSENAQMASDHWPLWPTIFHDAGHYWGPDLTGRVEILHNYDSFHNEKLLLEVWTDGQRLQSGNSITAVFRLRYRTPDPNKEWQPITVFATIQQRDRKDSVVFQSSHTISLQTNEKDRSVLVGEIVSLFPAVAGKQNSGSLIETEGKYDLEMNIKVDGFQCSVDKAAIEIVFP